MIGRVLADNLKVVALVATATLGFAGCDDDDSDDTVAETGTETDSETEPAGEESDEGGESSGEVTGPSIEVTVNYAGTREGSQLMLLAFTEWPAQSPPVGVFTEATAIEFPYTFELAIASEGEFEIVALLDLGEPTSNTPDDDDLVAISAPMMITADGDHSVVLTLED